MCRFLTYKGPKILMETLLIEAHNSLVVQSIEAKKRPKPVNGDGFGIGWYPLHDDPEPCVFTSLEPAWSNLNLHRLSGKIMSHCFFAHVRDATIGMAVSEANCHPFQFGRYLWMHNGRIDQFQKIKRELVNSLSDRAYLFIQGNTDSEHAFALFLDAVNFNQEAGTAEIREALVATLRRIMELRKKAGASTYATMNFGVTNGESTLVTRFVTHKKKKPVTLYTAIGKLVCESGVYRILETGNKEENAAIIASEPLTYFKHDWREVECNHIVITDKESDLRIEPLLLPFQNEL